MTEPLSPETRDRLEATYDATMDALRGLCFVLDRPVPGDEGFVVPAPVAQDVLMPARKESRDEAFSRRHAAKEAEKLARLGIAP